MQELLNPPIVEKLIKEEQTTIKTLAQQAETFQQQVEEERQQARN